MIPPAKQSTPQFKHYCDKCVYCGQIPGRKGDPERLDVYICLSEMKEPRLTSVVMRSSDEPSDYASMGFGAYYDMYQNGYQLLEGNGQPGRLVKNDPFYRRLIKCVIERRDILA